MGDVWVKLFTEKELDVYNGLPTVVGEAYQIVEFGWLLDRHQDMEGYGSGAGRVD